MSSAARPELSIVIPAYNEEDRIGGVLKKYANFHSSYEIIVVCNGCTDATVSIVEEMTRNDARIKLLVFKEKLGKGGAIIEGFKASVGKMIGFIDADESVGTADFTKLIEAARSNCDGAIASRRMKGARIPVKQPLRRRIASRAFNVLVKLIFGLTFEDTQCGAKIFRREVVEAILGDLRSRGFEFDVELLWRMKMNGYRVLEVPITWRYDRGSKFSLLHAPNMFLNLIRIRIQ